MNANEIKEARELAFEQWTFQLGGRIKKNLIPAAWLSSIDRLRRSAQYYIELSCQDEVMNTVAGHTHFDFIHNWEINACVFRDSTAFYIGYYVGAVSTPEQWAFRLLSHPETFPDIGRAMSETVRFSSLEPVPGAVPEPYAVLPHDWTRFDFAFITSYAIQMYIFFHELGHLFSGHLEFATRATANRILLEIEPSGSRTLAPVSLQAMELHADKIAAMVLIEDVAKFVRGQSNKPEFRSRFDKFHSQDSILRAVFFALCLVSLFFDRKRLTLSDYDSANHPHPLIRVLWMIELLSSKSAINQKSLEPTALWAMKSAAHALETVGIKCGFRVEPSKASTRLRHLKTELVRLLPELKPFEGMMRYNSDGELTPNK